MRFNAEEPTGLLDRKPPGKPSLLKLEQRAALAKAVEDGLKPELHGVVRWRLGDLVGWLQDTFEISLSRQTLGRELRRMGFRKLSAPHAVLMLDQAGWHMSNHLVVPANITLLPLPPRSPELNPVENARRWRNPVAAARRPSCPVPTRSP